MSIRRHHGRVTLLSEAAIACDHNQRHELVMWRGEVAAADDCATCSPPIQQQHHLPQEH